MTAGPMLDDDPRARWPRFYLAGDLELPPWSVTDVVVTALSGTHAATW